MTEHREIECRITGKVHMVMFRDFVQRKARSLGIVGIVENIEGGSLHVVAQGTEENLEKLIEHLHKGPFFARVAKAQVEWRTLQQTFSEFKILY